MRTHFVEILKEAMGSTELVSIHTDPDSVSSCSVGYVDCLDEDYVRLRSISVYGENAGYEVREINDIFRIDIKGNYERRLQFLRANSGKVFSDEELSGTSQQGGVNILLSTLMEAQEKNLIVTLWTSDSGDSVIGYIKSVSALSICILSVDDDGRSDGEVALTLSCVTAIDCNSNKGQVIRFLNQSEFYKQ